MIHHRASFVGNSEFKSRDLSRAIGKALDFASPINPITNRLMERYCQSQA